ncbi:TIGR03571 family LLM class oxidoreductase [Roseateles sp.]|uniref:TIGR03571 family LLM class oxidoreductase n=1 Tax=Roseateles sp. TaxID=1971397 RepID=UPI0025E9BA03|nr:TIGR03571 family LLM class oxidoreductase [Roseateles sp.]MBV8036386.1 TIGR03571 family LLM class oxidoreductase [Roseateles sp.]
MDDFNIAHDRVLASGRLTLGLMTPLARQPGALADLDLERLAAKEADRQGFASLWTRDVPLMVPQGADGESAALDDPFLWLSALGAVTRQTALGMAAAVLPLRSPLHLAKSSLSLDRMTGGRFILGLGSGDREAEFAAFGIDAAQRAEIFRDHWNILRAALSPVAHERKALRDATGGFDVLTTPAARVPMLVVGSARQTLQWIAANAQGWASYHRDEVRQQGRVALWQSALAERAAGLKKPFIQSLHLELVDDPSAPVEPIELGVRTGRIALTDYLQRLEVVGVAHVLLHLARGPRSVLDIVEELGAEVLPHFRSPMARGAHEAAVPA